MSRVALALLIAVMSAITAAAAVTGANALGPRTLAQARAIKAEITARYVRPKLVVTEASPTDVIESFLLLTPDFLGLRVVPADNGIHYAICPCAPPAPILAPAGPDRQARSRLAGRRSSSRCERS